MALFGFGRKTPRSPPDAVVAPAPAVEPAAPVTQPAAPIGVRETPEPRNDRGPHFPDELATAEQELIRTRRAEIEQGSTAHPIGVGGETI